MKKAFVKVPFEDLQENVVRNAGDVFACEDDRGEELMKYGLVMAVSMPKEASDKEEPVKSAPKSAGKK